MGLDRTFAHTFSVSVRLYKRFVDDILVVLDRGVETADLLDCLNSFHPNIVCTNDGTEGNKAVTFLDLDICILGNKLAFSTHRKPLASYAYTPFDSNHSSATLLGIVATEAVRLLRTNNSQHTFDKQRCFFHR